MLTLTDFEIEALAANIGSFSPEEQAQIAKVIEELERRKQAQRCQDNLIEFCKYMDPTYIVAPHHKKLAELLTQVDTGSKTALPSLYHHGMGSHTSLVRYFPPGFWANSPKRRY